MRNQAFVEMVENHYEEERRIAKIADGIITAILFKKGTAITKEDLYGEVAEDDDPCWIWLDDDRIVLGLRFNDEDKVMVLIEDKDGNQQETELEYLNRGETIEIADRLSQQDDDEPSDHPTEFSRFTQYGMVNLTPAHDEDGEFYYEMTDPDGGFYGNLYVDENTPADEITIEMVEEQIDENLNF